MARESPLMVFHLCGSQTLAPSPQDVLMQGLRNTSQHVKWSGISQLLIKASGESKFTQPLLYTTHVEPVDNMHSLEYCRGYCQNHVPIS